MSAWLHKTTEDFNYSDGGSFNTDGVGAFTAVSAAFNAHLGVLNHRNAYERMEAEQFSYLQGTPSLILPDEVSSSAQPASATEGVEKLSDQNRTTQYRAAFDGKQSIIFSFNEPQRINEYALTAARDDEECDPRSWILEGSLDGETWNLLSRITNQAFSLRYATQFYGAHVQSTSSYKYYRFTVTEVNGGNQLQIGQLQLFRFGSDVGIAPTQADDELKLNVRHGLLSIVAPHTAELTIHDMQGRLVARSSLKAGYGTYAMNVLRNGLYVVTLTSGERKVTRTVKR